MSGAPITINCLGHFNPATAQNTPGLPYQLSTVSNHAGEYIITGILPGPLKVTADARPFAWAVDLDNPTLEINAMATAGQDLTLDLEF